jgi:hypothetical protein
MDISFKHVDSPQAVALASGQWMPPAAGRIQRQYLYFRRQSCPSIGEASRLCFCMDSLSLLVIAFAVFAFLVIATVSAGAAAAVIAALFVVAIGHAFAFGGYGAACFGQNAWSTDSVAAVVAALLSVAVGQARAGLAVSHKPVFARALRTTAVVGACCILIAIFVTGAAIHHDDRIEADVVFCTAVLSAYVGVITIRIVAADGPHAQGVGIPRVCADRARQPLSGAIGHGEIVAGDIGQTGECCAGYAFCF